MCGRRRVHADFTATRVPSAWNRRKTPLYVASPARPRDRKPSVGSDRDRGLALSVLGCDIHAPIVSQGGAVGGKLSKIDSCRIGGPFARPHHDELSAGQHAHRCRVLASRDVLIHANLIADRSAVSRQALGKNVAASVRARTCIGNDYVAEGIHAHGVAAAVELLVPRDQLIHAKVIAFGHGREQPAIFELLQPQAAAVVLDAVFVGPESAATAANSALEG
jgi:hypothetical protein